MAAIAGHDNRLLAEIAPLGIADGPGGSADLDDEAVLVHVWPVGGRARLDAEDLVRLRPGRAGTAGDHGLPYLRGLLDRAEDVVTRQAQRIVPAHLTGDAGRIDLLVTQFGWGRFGVRQFTDDGRRRGPRKVHLGEFAGVVKELDLLTDPMAVEVLQHLLGQGTGHVQPVGILAVGAANVVNEQGRDQARLGRRQERFAAGARRQVEDVVGGQVVQEAGGLGASDLELAPP